MGRAIFRKTPISLSTQDKSRCLGTFSNVILWMTSQHEGAVTPQLYCPEKAAGSKYNSKSACHIVNNSRGTRSSIPQHKSRSDSPVPTVQRHCDRSQIRRGILRFPPQLEMRPCSSLQRCTRNPECTSQCQRRSDFPEEA